MARRLDWDKAKRNGLAAGPSTSGYEINSSEEADLQAWWDAKKRPPKQASRDQSKILRRGKKSKPSYAQRIEKADARAARRQLKLEAAMKAAEPAQKAEATCRLAQFKAARIKKSARARTRLEIMEKRKRVGANKERRER